MGCASSVTSPDNGNTPGPRPASHPSSHNSNGAQGMSKPQTTYDRQGEQLVLPIHDNTTRGDANEVTGPSKAEAQQTAKYTEKSPVKDDSDARIILSDPHNGEEPRQLRVADQYKDATVIHRGDRDNGGSTVILADPDGQDKIEIPGPGDAGVLVKQGGASIGGPMLNLGVPGNKDDTMSNPDESMRNAMDQLSEMDKVDTKDVRDAVKNLIGADADGDVVHLDRPEQINLIDPDADGGEIQLGESEQLDTSSTKVQLRDPGESNMKVQLRDPGVETANTSHTVPKEPPNVTRQDLLNKKMKGNAEKDVAMDSEKVEKGLLQGDLNVKCPQSARIVRVFLSSTFTDTELERNGLLERSYPHLKDLCKSHGYEFQLVDMRWGVVQAVTNDHLTSDMCLREIGLCKQLSTGPNFVTLLSHKYGYFAYPSRIEATLFERLASNITNEEDNTFLTERWFVYDENSVPPHYILRSISTHFPGFMSDDFDEYNSNRRLWNQECDRLVDILRLAYEDTEDQQSAADFIKGVTEREIELGIFQNPVKDQSCLWLKRDIKELRGQSKRISRFADTIQENEWSERSAHLLASLKEKLLNHLPPSNIETLHVEWTDDDDNPIGNSKRHVDEICDKFEAHVTQMFERARVAAVKEELNDLHLEELAHHTAIAQTKCTDFYGRKEQLEKICGYLLDTEDGKPLVIYGASGSGKSTLVAMIMKKTWGIFNEKVVIVTRFIGTSSESSRVGSVLYSMTRQIHRTYTDSRTKSQNEFTNFAETCENFTKSLALAKKDQPLLVLIDGFEQLDPLEEAMNLTWIPNPLPPNVKVIISTSDETLLIERLKPKKSEVKGFSPEDAMKTLKVWLERENRCLSQPQLLEVQEAFSQCSLPLYVRLVLQETLRWKSFSPVDETRLQRTVKEAVKSFFKRTEENHGKLFTAHCLGYLTLARRGLSESEMEDILSCDDSVLKEIYTFWVPPVRRLPPLLLVRLRSDLNLYIAQREMDRVPVLMWNHKLFSDVAYDMYCSDSAQRSLLHHNMADFFSGTWAGREKPFHNKNGEEDSKLRQVAPQPIRNGKELNYRKLGNLPWHLAHIGSSSVNRLKTECLFNIDFLIAKLEAFGVRSLIEDYTEAMECLGEHAETFSDVKMAIQISQKALLRNVNELPTQLLNRLDGKSKSNRDLKQLLNNCRSVSFPVLICDQQILAQPGGPLVYSIPCHSDRVLSLDLSNDGKTAVTCGEDRKVIVWDVIEGWAIFSLNTKDEEPIKSFLASNDERVVVWTNQSIATYGTDTAKCFGKVQFFQDTDTNTTDGHNIWQNGEIDSEKITVCVTGKAKLKNRTRRLTKAKVFLVTNSAIHVMGSRALEGYKRTEIQEFDKGRIDKHSHCFGSDTHLAVTDADRFFLRIFELNSLKEVVNKRIYQPFNISGGDNHIGPTIDAACFTSNGELLFVSNWKKGEILNVDKQSLNVTRALLSDDQPQNFRIATVGDVDHLYFPSEYEVIIRHFQRGDRACVTKHPCHVKFAATRDFNPLVTVGEDGQLRLWQYESKDLQWTKQEHQSNFDTRSVQLFRSNSRYALALNVCENLSRKIIVQDLLIDKTVRSATFKCNVEIEIFEEETANTTAIIRLPSGQLAIFDLNQMTVTDKLNAHSAQSDSPTKRTFTILHKRQEVLLIGDKSDVVVIYDLRTNQKKEPIDCHGGDVENFKVNSKESLVAIATEECSCIIYNLETNQVISRLSREDICPEDPEDLSVLKVSCVTEDRQYVVLETDYSVKVWRNKSGDIPGYIVTDLMNHFDGEVIDEMVSLRDNKLITACSDGTTRVFKISTGELLQQNSHHQQELNLSASQSDAYLTYGFGGQDNNIAVWSLHHQQPIATFTSEQELDQVTISPDGSYIIACLRNPARVVTWHVQDGKISRDKCLDGKELFQGERHRVIELDDGEKEIDHHDGHETETGLDEPDDSSDEL